MCMFTFQSVLSSETGVVCCTRTSKTDFTSRQHVQWLLNTHCLYTAAISHREELLQPSAFKK